MEISTQDIKKLFNCIRDLIYTPISFILNNKCTNGTLVTVLLNNCIKTQYILYKGKKYKLGQIGNFKDGYCTCCEEVIIIPDNNGSGSGSGDTGIGLDTPMRITRVVSILKEVPSHIANTTNHSTTWTSLISSFFLLEDVEQIVDVYQNQPEVIVSESITNNRIYLAVNNTAWKQFTGSTTTYELLAQIKDLQGNQLGQGIPIGILQPNISFISNGIILPPNSMIYYTMTNYGQNSLGAGKIMRLDLFMSDTNSNQSIPISLEHFNPTFNTVLTDTDFNACQFSMINN